MKTGKQTILTCPNKACGKVFAKPLTTLTLKQDSKEPYNACPYCLTEITMPEPESKNPFEKTTTEIAFLEEKSSQNHEEISNCKHYFGYMNQKEHKQQMPEECMLCSRIIECMKENGSAEGRTRLKK
jgi:DNA-directed RNA polymerase subunit RPC12/RpoP